MTTACMQAPVEEITRRCDPLVYSRDSINAESLRYLGFHIVPRFIQPEVVNQFLTKFQRGEGVRPLEHHPTRIACDQTWLQLILDTPSYETLFKSGVFFEGNIAVDLPFIFRKDAKCSNRVHLHNDSDYQMGVYDRYSLFLALTAVNVENGGLQLYPATHQFASLGDCGEIDPNILPDNYPIVEPDMAPGDLLVMHSGVWHKSPPPERQELRLYLELHIKPSTCPTAKFPLYNAPVNPFRNLCDGSEIFVSSREQKILRLYEQLAG